MPNETELWLAIAYGDLDNSLYSFLTLFNLKPFLSHDVSSSWLKFLIHNVLPI